VNGSIRFSFHGGAGKVAHDTVSEKDEREFRFPSFERSHHLHLTHMAMDRRWTVLLIMKIATDAVALAPP
jgi:hypothetical protein